MSDCIIWHGCTSKDGYGKVRFQGKAVYVHRLEFFKHYGYWPNICRHACDTPSCYNIEHLLDGSQADNMRDREERGRTVRGSRGGNSKLTEDQVRSVWVMSSDSISNSEIAKRLGVSHQLISSILNDKVWRHLELW